jgi:hypothetical protein
MDSRAPKQAPSKTERVIRTYAVRAIGAVFLMAVGSLVMHNSASAAPPAKKCASRGYYLTRDQWPGGQAPTACSAGYHMASLWEIFDTSSLQYDGTLGYTNADSGSGPPTGGVSGVGPAFGWVRTGGPSQTAAPPGMSNCNSYSSSSHEDKGTLVLLNTDWSLNATLLLTPTAPWVGVLGFCNDHWPVWCVED